MKLIRLVRDYGRKSYLREREVKKIGRFVNKIIIDKDTEEAFYKPREFMVKECDLLVGYVSDKYRAKEICNFINDIIK